MEENFTDLYTYVSADRLPFRPTFHVRKFVPTVPTASLLKRTWTFDFEAGEIQCYQNSSNSSKPPTTPHNKFSVTSVVKLERNATVPDRLRLELAGTQTYELLFKSVEERERLWECICLLRPDIITWCPDLCQPGRDYSSVCFGKDSVEDRVHARRPQLLVSRFPHETLRVWTITLNTSSLTSRDLQQCSTHIFASLKTACPVNEYDVYVFALQEAAESWADILAEHLGRMYYVVSSQTFTDLRLLVFAHHTLSPKICQTHSCSTQLAQAKNCVALAISLQVYETSLCFINCYLPSAPISPDEARSAAALKQLSLAELFEHIRLCQPDLDVFSQFQNVFILGSLNFGTTMTKDRSKELYKSWYTPGRTNTPGSKSPSLVPRTGEAALHASEVVTTDLLNQCRRQPHSPVVGGPLMEFLQEGDMASIPPTYPYCPPTFPQNSAIPVSPIPRSPTGTDDLGSPMSGLQTPTAASSLPTLDADHPAAPYHSDRILWKSFRPSGIALESCDSPHQLCLGKHSPVSCTFLIDIQRPFVSSFMKNTTPSCVFQMQDITISCTAGNIKDSVEKPHLLFWPTFSTHCPPRTSHALNPKQDPQYQDKVNKLTWVGSQLPQLHPYTSHKDYMAEQYLTIALCDANKNGAFRGAAVLPLATVVAANKTLKHVETRFYQHCRDIGTMRCAITFQEAISVPDDGAANASDVAESPKTHPSARRTKDQDDGAESKRSSSTGRSSTASTATTHSYHGISGQRKATPTKTRDRDSAGGALDTSINSNASGATPSKASTSSLLSSPGTPNSKLVSPRRSLGSASRSSPHRAASGSSTTRRTSTGSSANKKGKERSSSSTAHRPATSVHRFHTPPRAGITSRTPLTSPATTSSRRAHSVEGHGHQRSQSAGLKYSHSTTPQSKKPWHSDREDQPTPPTERDRDAPLPTASPPQPTPRYRTFSPDPATITPPRSTTKQHGDNTPAPSPIPLSYRDNSKSTTTTIYSSIQHSSSQIVMEKEWQNKLNSYLIIIESTESATRSSLVDTEFVCRQSLVSNFETTRLTIHQVKQLQIFRQAHYESTAHAAIQTDDMSVDIMGLPLDLRTKFLSLENEKEQLELREMELQDLCTALTEEVNILQKRQGGPSPLLPLAHYTTGGSPEGSTGTTSPVPPVLSNGDFDDINASEDMNDEKRQHPDHQQRHPNHSQLSPHSTIDASTSPAYSQVDLASIGGGSSVVVDRAIEQECQELREAVSQLTRMNENLSGRLHHLEDIRSKGAAPMAGARRDLMQRCIVQHQNMHKDLMAEWRRGIRQLQQQHMQLQQQHRHKLREEQQRNLLHGRKTPTVRSNTPQPQQHNATKPTDPSPSTSSAASLSLNHLSAPPHHHSSNLSTSSNASVCSSGAYGATTRSATGSVQSNVPMPTCFALDELDSITHPQQQGEDRSNTPVKSTSSVVEEGTIETGKAVSLSPTTNKGGGGNSSGTPEHRRLSGTTTGYVPVPTTITIPKNQTARTTSPSGHTATGRQSTAHPPSIRTSPPPNTSTSTQPQPQQQQGRSTPPVSKHSNSNNNSSNGLTRPHPHQGASYAENGPAQSMVPQHMNASALYAWQGQAYNHQFNTPQSPQFAHSAHTGFYNHHGSAYTPAEPPSVWGNYGY